MAEWGEWSEEHIEIFNEIPGTEYLEGDDRLYAQDLYELGFGHTEADYDALGIDPDTVHQAREDFFDFMGLEYDDFPWDDWREAMGYGDD